MFVEHCEERKESRSSLDVPQLSQKLLRITKSEKESCKTSKVTAELKLAAARGSDGSERTRLKTRVVEVECFSQQQQDRQTVRRRHGSLEGVLVEWEGLTGRGRGFSCTQANTVNY